MTELSLAEEGGGAISMVCTSAAVDALCIMAQRFGSRNKQENPGRAARPPQSPDALFCCSLF